ncbi:MAG: NfeD family protein [Phycisphaerae bacterium]
MMPAHVLKVFVWVVAVLALGTAVAVGQATAPAPVGGGAPMGIGGIGGAAAPAAQPLQPPHDKAAIIRLNAEVDDIMRESLERRIDVARKAGCTLVVLEMDTYGGLLTSALAIDKIVKKLPSEHMDVVAWVHDKAYSAGAFISLSCEQIVMSREAAMGDCAPIQINPIIGGVNPMPAAERAKAVSPIIEDLDESAAQNHYDKMVLRAMVVAEIEIHKVHNNDTGEVRYVDTDQKNKLLAEEVVGPGGVKHRPWQFDDTVDNASQLLTVSDATALQMGLSKATVDNEQDLRAALNIRGDILVLNFNWAEIATAFLTKSIVRLMLFVAMLVFAWIEFSHPGATLPGVAAIICLVLLVGAPFLTGLAQAWEIIFIVLGLGIIVTDLFVFGGIGLLAVPGFLLMAIGLIASFVPQEPGGGFVPTMPQTWAALQNGLGVVVFGSLIALVGFFLLSKYLYMTPGFRRLQLAPAVPAATAANVNAGRGIRDSADRPADEAVFIGALGKASTDLRPAGKARFDEHLVDVVSNGGFVPRGTEVEVIQMAGAKVIVRPAVARTEGVT